MNRFAVAMRAIVLIVAALVLTDYLNGSQRASWAKTPELLLGIALVVLLTLGVAAFKARRKN